MINDNARLAVTTPAGTAYFRIAEAEQLDDGYIRLVLVTTDWLDAGVHQATLIDGDLRVEGYLSVYDYRSTAEKIEILGIWIVAPVGSV